jgi:hypothetical protein
MGDSNPARAAYVAFLREHHPDRGGNVETFVAGLAVVRAAYRMAAQHGHHRDPLDRYDAPIVLVVRPRGLYAVPGRVRQWRNRRFRKPRVR